MIHIMPASQPHSDRDSTSKQRSMENGAVSPSLPHHQPPPAPKGGLITMPFIIANEAFEKVATYGSQINAIFYLLNEYKLTLLTATNLIFYWTAATYLLPLAGAFVSDSYLGRFLTIALASFVSLLGTVLLWLTAMIPKARPPPCNQYTQHCKGPTPGQYALLLSAFGLTAIGAGGIRACSMAFGADQIVCRDELNNVRVLEKFFNWYYASYAASVVVAFSAIVYIQSEIGWKVGFGVPAVLMFLGVVVFLLSSSLYFKRKASKSLLTGLVQVIVVAYKNRGLECPPKVSKRYHYVKGSLHTSPSEKLRFLNRACIIKNPQDVTSAGVAANNWTLCTTDQVEELKALIRILPMWSTGIMIAISMSQNSFPSIQASSMDRHLTKNFQIPASSFFVFVVITITLWIILYDRAIIPLASKIVGRKVRISVKLRMGVGAFLVSIAMTVSGIVEHIRRRKAIEQGLGNNPAGVVDMSAMWLIPQYCLVGLAEALFSVGQNEFFYSEFPKSMSSVAASLNGLGIGVGNMVATVVTTVVDRATKGEGKESWLSKNINKGHIDYYYWMLGGMTFLNAVYYGVCSWAYGPAAADKAEDKKGEEENGNGNVLGGR